jgi:branched-subunit amino acid aminotransferase/4-amino-4-deoxychorismate lyase
MNASEVFLTASSKEITPIVKIDDTAIGAGQVGPVTKAAIKQFKEYTSKN